MTTNAFPDKLSSLDLNKLRFFAVVAEYENFSRAANELMISQPALSVHVRELSRHYGTPLFERYGRGVRLTEAGKLVYTYARSILALAAESEEAVENLKGLRTGVLQVGAVQTAGDYILPLAIAEFRGRHPGVRVSIEIGEADGLAEKVRDGKLHMAMLGEPPQEPALEITRILDDDLLLIVPPGHRFAGREIEACQLQSERFILKEHGSVTRKITEQALSEHGICMQVELELGSMEAIKRVVAAGLAVAVVPACSVSTELESGTLEAARIRGLSLRRSFYIARRNTRQFSALETEFIDALRSMAARQGGSERALASV